MATDDTRIGRLIDSAPSSVGITNLKNLPKHERGEVEAWFNKVGVVVEEMIEGDRDRWRSRANRPLDIFFGIEPRREQLELRRQTGRVHVELRVEFKKAANREGPWSLLPEGTEAHATNVTVRCPHFMCQVL